MGRLSPESEVLEVQGEGVLPLVARLSKDPPRYLLKSGRVGGPEGERGSLAISDGERQRALEAARTPSAEWEADPDLGVELLVSGAPDVPEGLLVPRFLYRRADRIYEYAAAMPAAKARMQKLLGA